MNKLVYILSSISIVCNIALFGFGFYLYDTVENLKVIVTLNDKIIENMTNTSANHSYYSNHDSKQDEIEKLRRELHMLEDTYKRELDTVKTEAYWASSDAQKATAKINKLTKPSSLGEASQFLFE